jgi:Fic family protein
MKLDILQIKKLKDININEYKIFKNEFLFHSNKIEGSTFSKEELLRYLERAEITGTHSIDDIQETVNSVELFDFVIDTLGERLSKTLILEFQALLKKNTNLAKYNLTGFKKIQNSLLNVDLQLAQPFEVEEKLTASMAEFEHSPKDITAIATFHAQFEIIHPFVDGNGRVGRFIIFKQCLENHIDLIAIDEKFENAYKNALYQAQKYQQYEGLVKVFENCQVYLDEKLQGQKEVLGKI